MIFYKRITICNLFAYYGEQNVEFTLSQGKPIYLLFGRNGFGKTSFIRSVKLLFAGSGMLDVGENVPEVVLNFTGTRSRGVFTPRVLLLGQNSENGWRGAFNRRALSNDENKFYIELVFDEDKREIIIRREWSRFPDLCEKLIFIKYGERLENNQAREEIERILPLNFLQFFVFDGEEIEALEVEKLEASENLRKNIEQKTNSEKYIGELEIEIAALKDKAARDLRIKKKLNLLSEIKTQIITYKSGRIARTGERLKDKILSNYKHLIAEDNVADIKIDNFIVKFIDASGEAIAVRSQSAGQKQIAAISIFWALAKLSDRCLPLIIDTPLARLDASNRKNVIQNYYANASNQVIVLPTDTEFSQRELEFASGKIAGIYDITNDKDSRDSASIKPRRE